MMGSRRLDKWFPYAMLIIGVIAILELIVGIMTENPTPYDMVSVRSGLVVFGFVCYFRPGWYYSFMVRLIRSLYRKFGEKE